jgi:hypothetical protein
VTNQFMRYGQLVVSNSLLVADLSALRFRFEVRASDAETPNTLTVRVYNVSKATIQSIIGSTNVDNGKTTVTLNCGYQSGNKGCIFSGDIKQFRVGRERNVDSYLDILAGDGDAAYNQSIINQSFPSGTTDAQQLSAIAASMGLPVADGATGYLTTGGILPRGKVLFGMSRIYMRSVAHNNGCRWSIQNGVATLIPNGGYLPTPNVVVISTATGMIGTPEATDAGIMVRCYLNASIQIGQMIQINNGDINTTTVESQGYPSYTSQYYPASLSANGQYRVMVIEHIGDMRGNDWYSEMTCLNIDQSAASTSAVLLNG